VRFCLPAPISAIQRSSLPPIQFYPPSISFPILFPFNSSLPDPEQRRREAARAPPDNDMRRRERDGGGLWAAVADRDGRIVADRDGRRSSTGRISSQARRRPAGAAAQRGSTRLPTVGGRGGGLVRRRTRMEASAVLGSRRPMRESRWG
jgi:hypothetical protein